MLKAIRPFIRKFHSSEYINALAGGDICLAFGYSGDILQARDRAAKAAQKRDIAYAIPNEGAMLWIDVAAIPKDAPNPDAAHKLPRLHARAQGRRRVERAHRLRQRQRRGDRAARPSRSPSNPLDLSAAPTMRAQLYTITAGNAEQTRERTRLWTAIKTGR